MDDMRSVQLHVDTVLLLGIDVASDVIPAVDHIAFLSCSCHFMRKYSAIQPCPYDQIIKLHIHLLHSRQGFILCLNSSPAPSSVFLNFPVLRNARVVIQDLKDSLSSRFIEFPVALHYFAGRDL